ncbi:hypothetical protein [Nocardioides terrisoli]|uniref:hypothetical protein n=1 Tax=Nocardioides terrisoli TaxID=3388267 RepID=UPI00287BAD6A|nr:hypothetical protein [Nocardioides marmorisolisilvae]
MEIDECLSWHGGFMSYRLLVAEFGRGDVRAALRQGRIVRVGRGSYGLPGGPEARAAARRLAGVLSHTSAAIEHGWPVKVLPRQPHVTVPRHRTVAAGRRRQVTVHYADVRTDGLVTTPAQTVVDCARALPFDEALCIADSALRSGMVTAAELEAAALAAPRTGRSRAIRVVTAADARAANPFESVIRAISLEFPQLNLEPQVQIAGLGRPDLHDRRLGLVVECDSFRFHASRAALVHDIERYNECAQRSLSLLRFAWEHSMLRQDYVREQFSTWLVAHGLSVQRPVRPTPA